MNIYKGSIKFNRLLQNSYEFHRQLCDKLPLLDYNDCGLCELVPWIFFSSIEKLSDDFESNDI